MIKFIKPALLMSVGIALVVSLFLYIGKLNEDLGKARQANIHNVMQIEELAKSYSEFAKMVNSHIYEQNNINTRIASQQFENRMELVELSQTFTITASGERRDFENIMERRPTLLESRINNATSNIAKEIELITNYHD